MNTPPGCDRSTAKHYRQDKPVAALMVEVRRDLYMDEETGENNAQFEVVRAALEEVMERLEMETQN